MQIVTNNKPRPVLSWWELSERQRAFVKKEHDWLFEKDDQRYEDERYIPFKGWVYLLSEFMIIEGIKDWEATAPDSAFSGVLIKIVGCNNCIIGRYYA